MFNSSPYNTQEYNAGILLPSNPVPTSTGQDSPKNISVLDQFLRIAYTQSEQRINQSN